MKLVFTKTDKTLNHHENFLFYNKNIIVLSLSFESALFSFIKKNNFLLWQEKYRKTENRKQNS